MIQSCKFIFSTDNSKVLYNSSKDGKFFGLRDLKKNTFDIFENKKINNDTIISSNIISININENKFPESDKNKNFFNNNFCCFTTSDKICYIVDLYNKKKVSISSQSKINKIIFDEENLILGMLLSQSDGSSLVKMYKLNKDFQLDFITSIIDDEKKSITDILFVKNGILISYKNIIEFQLFEKVNITNNIFYLNENISKIHFFSKCTNECILSSVSGNVYKINLNSKSESFIIKPTSIHHVKINENNCSEDAFIFSTFDKSLYIYILKNEKLIKICNIPNIYLTACEFRGDILSLGFLDGKIIIIWIKNINEPSFLKNFQISELSYGEESINNLWQYNFVDKINDYYLGFQTTSGIFLVK